MPRWAIRMTFRGEVEGATSSDAVAEFKSQLGVAPESMRPMAKVTDFQVTQIDEPQQVDGFEVEL